MRYENSFDTEVQKIDIFPYLSIQTDNKDKGSFEKSKHWIKIVLPRIKKKLFIN